MGVWNDGSISSVEINFWLHANVPLCDDLGYLRWDDYFMEPQPAIPRSPRCYFFAMKHNSFFWTIFVVEKYHYPPCSPFCYFFAMNHNSNFLERYVAPKNTTILHSPAPCNFFAMKSNSNFFELYLSSKNTTILRVPLFAIFSPWKVIQTFLNYICRQKIPLSSVLLLVLFFRYET